MSFVFRKTTKAEDENYNNRCSINLPNSMRCPRRITRFVNEYGFLCEGHFASLQQHSQIANEQNVNLDEGGELLTSKSEPTEK